MKNMRYFILGFVACLTFVFTMEHFRSWTPWHTGNMRAENARELMKATAEYDTLIEYAAKYHPKEFQKMYERNLKNYGMEK